MKSSFFMASMLSQELHALRLRVPLRGVARGVVFVAAVRERAAAVALRGRRTAFAVVLVFDVSAAARFVALAAGRFAVLRADAFGLLAVGVSASPLASPT